MARKLAEFDEYITPLLTQEQIQNRIEELAAEINRDYVDKDLIIVGVLKGVFPFFADLVRRIELSCRCDFLGLSSYGSRTETSGVVRVTSDLTQPVGNKDVLVVEDIVDSGLTMKYLLDNMATRQPRSVKICTLLHKPENERVSIPLDYVGFVVENHFVIGYGLDYAERFRNLPYIGYFAGDLPDLD